MPRWFGRLLRHRRSDDALSVWNRLPADHDIRLTSSSFGNGEPIATRFAARKVGENVSPAFEWTTPPDSTEHLVFVLEDVDVPFPRPLMHAIAVLPSSAMTLEEGALTARSGGVEFARGGMGSGYTGPRPIVGHGAHRYRFMLFAVDTEVDLRSQKAAIDSITGHVLASGLLVGTYER